MNYKDEITKAMSMLAQDDRVIFLGQSVAYPGHIMTATFENIAAEKLIELPVAEEMQLGMCLGLALTGYIPVSVFPRMDFLLLAMNQLVNHLDKMEEMAGVKPKVIIRTMVGSINPMHPGPQHCQDYTEALKLMLTNIDVVKLAKAEEIVPAYLKALESDRSTILIEAPPKRAGYED